MSDFFRASAPPPHNTALRVSGRHIKPCSDELAFSVEHGGGIMLDRLSVVLSRPAVRDLHAALGRWLDEGWPGVAQTETRQVGAA